MREINELKEARDIFLEETTALNARNEELAELNSQIVRQIDMASSEATLSVDQHSLADGYASTPESGAFGKHGMKGGMSGIFGGVGGKTKNANGNLLPANPGPNTWPSVSSINTNMSTVDEKDELGRISKATTARVEPGTEPIPAPKKFKWFGGAMKSSEKDKKMKPKAHTFQLQNVLRFARCDHCGDKMWGTQSKCTGEF